MCKLYLKIYCALCICYVLYYYKMNIKYVFAIKRYYIPTTCVSKSKDSTSFILWRIRFADSTYLRHILKREIIYF